MIRFSSVRSIILVELKMKKSIKLRRCEILDTKLERIRLKSNDLSETPVMSIIGATKLVVLSGKQEKNSRTIIREFRI